MLKRHPSGASFSFLDLFETLSVGTHHGVHGHESLGVFVFYDAQDGLRFTLVRHNHQDVAFVLGVPACAFYRGHATVHFVGDAVSHFFRL